MDARRIAEYAITHYRKIALYLPAEKELCQLRTWLILRAHLAKQRVAKLVLLEKLDYKEKFADVSIQRSMLQEEIAYAETHMKTIEREMKELIAADSNICRNYKLLTSIKGVGPITAIVMLCSTLNFTKSQTTASLPAIAGWLRSNIAPAQAFAGDATHRAWRIETLKYN